MNASNVCTWVGRIPAQEKLMETKAVMYRPATENKKAYYMGKISVPRPQKDENGHYITDFHNFKLFGHDAEYFHEYVKAGDTVLLVGSVYIDPDYEKEDGTVGRGRTYMNVDTMRRLTGSTSSSEEGATGYTKKAETAAAPAKPKSQMAAIRNLVKAGKRA